MLIRPYQASDEQALIALWEACGLTRPWNNPSLDIQRKTRVQAELFLVGCLDDQLVAGAMAGYDGHRGWVNYLAVHPALQGAGLGRQMMQAVESGLLGMGCPKLNLQVRTDNNQAVAFYEKLGYKTDPVISMGKRLIVD